MSNPKISIIIPVYNAEMFIEKCLNSAITQSFLDIEIICINDGSNDNSLKILNKFKEKDKRIKVFSQEHLGMNKTINLGISKSNGEYTLFLKDNAWIEKNSCEKFYLQTKKLNADILLFNTIEHIEDKLIEHEYFPNNSFKHDNNTFTFDYHFKKDIIMNQMPILWSKFYKTSLLKDNITYNEQQEYDNILFHISAIISAKKIGYFKNSSYHYTKLNHQTSCNTKNKTENDNININIFYEIKDFLKSNNKYDELKNNFIKFVIKQSKDKLTKADNKTKSSLFNEIKEYLIELNINDYLNKITIQDYKFYIHLINSDNYAEFYKFQHSKKIEINNYELILSNIINEKNEEIYSMKNQISKLKNENDILNKFYEDYLSNNELISYSYEKIKENDLFNEDYYRYHEGYDGNIDPYLHYIYKGFEEGKNPSNLFDSKFYMENNKDIDMNPLIHFINYSLKEGNVKIRPEIEFPPGLNKIEIDEKLSKFNSRGITTDERNPKLIVSLTSYPERINTIKYTLFSLLNQNLKPDKIILWLSESEFAKKEKDIPQDVLNLKKFGLEIFWCENLKSYKKLIPTLEKYPRDLIVTIDDDIYLPKDWLKKLYEFHLKYPQYIICHRARRISFDENNELLPYIKWDLIKKENEASFLNMFTGVGGVLYPPNSLDNEVLNKNLFMELSPTSDDLWFWAMAIKKGTKIKVVKDNMYSLTYVSPEEEFNIFGNSKTLWLKNSNGLNDIHLQNILKKYPKILETIKKCDVE